jgi:asparagine synthase (glutamine-hydrolysing)
MLGALAHRGPDDEGVHTEPGLFLGQRRLSIIDLEGGHQPLANEDGSVWIVFNGEIYNYRELRDELLAKGHRFATRSDTEVIVHLYEELGEGCLERLRGMFAFAIWDAKHRRLFAARDHLGQKPFYYVERGGALHFASEIKALLALDPAWAELDPAALDQYLTLRVVAPPHSMFRPIRKLPPAHSLTFTPGAGVRVQRYWSLDYEPKHAEPEARLVDRLEEAILESLRLHVVSDVPVGAYLSGGLDSSLLVAMLARHVAREPIRTFSLGLPYARFDEAPHARRVAERYGTRHHEATVRPSILALLPRLVAQLDEPSDPLAAMGWEIAAMASRHVKVVLGGDGGDELFGGYDRYYGQRYAALYAMLPATLRRGLVAPLLAGLPDGRWYKSRAHQAKWLHELSFFAGGERYAASLSYFYFGPVWRERLYGASFRASLAASDPFRCITEPYDAAGAVESIDRMLWADSAVRMPDHSVMILDRVSMAHGLEARSPFMDHRLAEFAARLPVHQKVRGRSLRRIQRRLAARYLPREILERPKQGFSTALPYLLRDEYARMHRALLSPAELARDGILRQDAIDALLAEHAGGRVDHGNRLWLLASSEAWYRLFVRGASEADLRQELAGGREALAS